MKTIEEWVEAFEARVGRPIHITIMEPFGKGAWVAVANGRNSGPWHLAGKGETATEALENALGGAEIYDAVAAHRRLVDRR